MSQGAHAGGGTEQNEPPHPNPQPTAHPDARAPPGPKRGGAKPKARAPAAAARAGARRAGARAGAGEGSVALGGGQLGGGREAEEARGAS